MLPSRSPRFRSSPRGPASTELAVISESINKPNRNVYFVAPRDPRP